MSTSLLCPLYQQADSALHILSGCRHKIVTGMITGRHDVACRLIMKAISKGSLAGCLVQLDAALIAWLNRTFKFLSMLTTGHYPAGYLMLVYLLEIDSPLVAPTPFWSPRYLKNPNRQPLLTCTRCHNHGNPAEMYAELTSSMSI